MLAVLKAWTDPIGHETRVMTCGEDDVDLDTNADIVAFSVYTFMAPAAYRLSDILRKKGKVVILGGPHFNGMQTMEEGAAHASVVARSIHRGQWEKILHDVECGKISPYNSQPIIVHDAEHSFRFPDNLHEVYRELGRTRFPLLMSTLGCPHRCEFCSPFMPGRYVLRDIDEVSRELESVRARHAALCDATFALNKTHSMALLSKIAGLGKYLFIQTTLHHLDDGELLDALARAGVVVISVGIESLSSPMKKHGKNKIHGDNEKLSRIIDMVTDRGILVQGSFICGLDTDTADCFDRIHEFYVKSNLNSIIIDIMTPYPNTPLYNRLENEGRIIDRDWSRYDFHNLVYRPLNMTEDELVSGFIQLSRSVASVPNLIRKNTKLIRSRNLNGKWPMIGLSLTQYADARRKEKSLEKARRVMALSCSRKNASAGLAES